LRLASVGCSRVCAAESHPGRDVKFKHALKLAERRASSRFLRNTPIEFELQANTREFAENNGSLDPELLVPKMPIPDCKDRRGSTCERDRYAYQSGEQFSRRCCGGGPEYSSNAA